MLELVQEFVDCGVELALGVCVLLITKLSVTIMLYTEYCCGRERWEGGNLLRLERLAAHWGGDGSGGLRVLWHCARGLSGMRRRKEDSKDVVARRISSHAIRGCFFAAWIQRSTLYINKTIRPGINSLPEPPKSANPIWTSTALSPR